MSLFSSSSKSSSNTTSIDQRLVQESGLQKSLSGGSRLNELGENSILVGTGSKSAVTINTTDAGSISGALNLAMKGIETFGGIADRSIQASQAATSSAGSLVSGAVSAMGQQMAGFTDSLERANTQDGRPVLYVALAAVAFVAFTMMKKG